jgi:hypothetical protein
VPYSASGRLEIGSCCFKQVKTAIRLGF